MSGYCPDCGNTLCLCDEVTRETYPFRMRILELEQRLSECEEALGFYADDTNYSPEYLRQGVAGRHGKQKMFLDGGKKARAYLSKYKQDTNG